MADWGQCQGNRGDTGPRRGIPHGTCNPRKLLERARPQSLLQLRHLREMTGRRESYVWTPSTCQRPGQPSPLVATPPTPRPGFKSFCWSPTLATSQQHQECRRLGLCDYASLILQILVFPSGCHGSVSEPQFDTEHQSLKDNPLGNPGIEAREHYGRQARCSRRHHLWLMRW